MEDAHPLSISQEEQGERLDIVLARHAGLTRSAAARLIDEGRVLVDGRGRKPAFKVGAGMLLTWSIPEEVPSDLEPSNLALNVIYEDDWIVVIDKPAGLVVHPGAGNTRDTLVNALIARYPDMAAVGSRERPGIVHRLDKLTTGVMVVARNRDAYYSLSESFKVHAHQRIYLAVCYGRMPRDTGRIATLINRHPADRKRMSTKVKTGREAVTNWQVERAWAECSFLKLRLETGRTHQIRVHLSDMGHPIVGDGEYGGTKRAHALHDPVVRGYVRKIDRQMLHAHILGINHPATNEYMEFVSMLPEDMRALIALLDERTG
ncbi:MAG: RluA family pseudouridine synthase [Syntrophaceae bacterium]